MDTTTFNKILDTLSREYPPKDWTKGMRPFEVLVSVVISQNTAVANERRALKELRRRVGITPEALAKAPLRDLEEALRPAGLHRTRARRLKEIATLLSREHGGDLPEILRRPMEQARDALLSLPGVGPKTADVVLSMVAGLPTFPVDTHIWRIAERWEIGQKMDYEQIRGNLESLVSPEDRKSAHLVLIRFGRETCTARRPKCPICPVAPDCPFYEKIRAGKIRISLFD
ncbi:MAG: endonuclease III [Thermoplasmata archaeon]